MTRFHLRKVVNKSILRVKFLVERLVENPMSVVIISCYQSRYNTREKLDIPGVGYDDGAQTLKKTKS